MNGKNSHRSLLNGTATEVPSLHKPQSRRPGPEACLPVPKLRFRAAAGIVFAISVLCFCISYDGDFVYDDKKAIVENNNVLPQTPWQYSFKYDFWGIKMDSNYSHKSYRPLTILSFRMSYYFGGGLNPIWFHVPNILLHGAISVLLLHVFSTLFGGYEVDPDSGKTRFKAAKSAFLCTILFAVHPIHTESVAGIVGRADLLCALLFLLSFLLYIKACHLEIDDDEDKMIIYRPASFSITYILGSMLLCFLSMLCKEQGITVLGICSAYDLIIICNLDPLQLLGLRKSEQIIESIGPTIDRNNNWKPLRNNPWLTSLLKRHLILVLTGLLIIMFRLWMMGSTEPRFVEYDNPHSYQNGTLLRGLNYNYLYSLHAWLLVHPWWLCFDWSMGSVPLIKLYSDARIVAGVALWTVLGMLFNKCLKTPILKEQSVPLIQLYSDARIVGGVALWTVLGMLFYKCLKTPILQEQRVLTMALAFIIVPFLPASNVFFRVGFVVAERILYLPSIGFCMLVVVGIRQICSAYPKQVQLIQLILTCLFCVFVLRCIQRSTHWRTALELYRSGEKVCPLNAKIHYNIGKVMGDAGHTDYAIEKYNLAIRLYPKYPPALNNLGLKLYEKKEYLDAENLFKKAIEYQNNFAFAWMNLGLVRQKLKKYKEAESCYQTALKYQPNYPKCVNNLANLYLDMDMVDKAIEGWTNATKLDPTLAFPWINLAFQLEYLERYEESLEYIRKGLKYLPESEVYRLYFIRANIYGKQGRWKESEKNFLHAIKLKPTFPSFYGNLGVLYQRWKKFDLAEQYYRKALSLEPNNEMAKMNLANLLKLRQSPQQSSGA